MFITKRNNIWHVSHRRNACRCGNSGGMDNNYGDDPSTWGPSLWTRLHENSLNYDPTKNGKNISSMFKTLPDSVCDKCRPTVVNYLSKNSYEDKLSTRYDVVKYIFDFHNFINQKLDKPIFSWEEFLVKFNPDYKTYKTLRPQPPPPQPPPPPPSSPQSI